jgi:hypothetical protein
MHGLYWLVANLAARQPLVLAVDDAHWADAPSLRWLAHLAARVEHLPVALLLAVRDGPDEPELLGELRTAGTRMRLRPLGPDATAALVRRRLGALPDDGAGEELFRECHASTGGNPFLLEALATALRDGDQKAEPIAQAVLRRIGPEAGRLTLRAGGPRRPRAAPSGRRAGRPGPARPRRGWPTGCAPADVLAPGSVLEFAHPIVRTAVYESIPPGERALGPRRSGPAAGTRRGRRRTPRAAPAAQRAGRPTRGWRRYCARPPPPPPDAATRARPRPACAARWTKPPPAADRPGLLLELGIALARERSPAAVPAPAGGGRAGRPGRRPAGRAGARHLGPTTPKRPPSAGTRWPAQRQTTRYPLSSPTASRPSFSRTP